MCRPRRTSPREGVDAGREKQDNSAERHCHLPLHGCTLIPPTRASIICPDLTCEVFGDIAGQLFILKNFKREERRNVGHGTTSVSANSYARAIHESRFCLRGVLTAHQNFECSRVGGRRVREVSSERACKGRNEAGPLDSFALTCTQSYPYNHHS